MSWGNANIGSSGGGNVISVNGKTGVVDLNAFDIAAAPSILKVNIELAKDGWELVEGKDNLYRTFAMIVGDYMITSMTKIDLQPDDEIITQLYNDEVAALYIKNEDDLSQYAYALGNKPSVDLVIQATLTDMGTIPGNVPITYIKNEYGGYTAVVGMQNITVPVTYVANEDGGYTAQFGAQEV